MRISTVALISSGWVALAATSLPAASPGRIILTLAFVLICPGAAVMRIFDATRPEEARYEPMLRAALTVAASLAIATLASQAFFLAGAFTAVRCVVALAALTSLMALAPAAGARRASIARSPRTGSPSS